MAVEADAAAELVDLQPIGADQGRQGAADHPHPGLQLKGAILTLAEPQAEPGVGITLRPDVRHAKPVAPDGDRSGEPGDAHGSVDVGEPGAERPQEGPRPVHRDDGTSRPTARIGRGRERISTRASIRSGAIGPRVRLSTLPAPGLSPSTHTPSTPGGGTATRLTTSNPGRSSNTTTSPGFTRCGWRVASTRSPGERVGDMLSSAISYRRRRKVKAATATLQRAAVMRGARVAAASGLDRGRV